MLKSETPLEELVAAFHSDVDFTTLCRRFGISPNRLRSIWAQHHGVEAVEARSKRFRKGASEAAHKGASEAFFTNEPFKTCAARLGMSPNTLRKLWIGAHGLEAFQNRGRALQSSGAKKHGLKTQGKSKTLSYVTVECEQCRVPLRVSKGSQARVKNRLCDLCRGWTTLCPVCNVRFDPKGLLKHIRRAGDNPHKVYLREQEDLKWGARVEGRDYVVCQECGFRGPFIGKHLKVHGITPAEYKLRYPKASLGSAVFVTSRHSSLLVAARQRAYNWDREDLLKYTDEEGRVIVAEAAISLKASSATVLQYCRELGIPTRNRLAWQRLVLDQASAALGSRYIWEWSDPRLANPVTGRPFNYDGYFPSLNLIVEVHGDQHFRYSEAWHGSIERFHALRHRDRLKREKAEALGYKFIEVLTSDPTQDPDFWNKPTERSRDVAASKVEEAFQKHRKEGFPQLVPLRIEVKKALTRLRGVETYLDDAGVIRPYSTVGTSACGSFFPSRYEARYKGALSVREAWQDDVSLRKAIRLQVSSGHPTTPERVLRALVMYHRTPSVFRPAVAKYIYETYASGGVVWDPCAGYGGRLLGAVAAGVRKYIGCDIELETVRGLQGMLEVLGDSSVVHCAKAEEFDPGEALDLVFTSPPYYDLETYGPASDTRRSYGSVASWLTVFVLPILQRAFDRLRSEGVLVLNLPQKPVAGVRLDEAVDRLAQSVGFVPKASCWMPVRAFKGAFKVEPVLIWGKL